MLNLSNKVDSIQMRNPCNQRDTPRGTTQVIPKVNIITLTNNPKSIFLGPCHKILDTQPYRRRMRSRNFLILRLKKPGPHQSSPGHNIVSKVLGKLKLCFQPEN